MFEPSLPSTGGAYSGGVFLGPVAVILLFLVLVIIALAVFLIYSAIYRRRVNRALRQETPVGPTPEPRNAGKIILIALVAACVLWFLIWTVNQQKRLAKLEEDLSAQMSEISELLDQQAEALRQQNSVFADMQVHCTAIDPENRTMVLTFTVVTKAVSDDTRVRMAFGIPYDNPVSLSDFGEIIELEQWYDREFRSSVTFPLFENYYDEADGCYSQSSEDAGVIFELSQNGVRQTDTLRFKKTLWQEQMPRVNYSCSKWRFNDTQDAKLVLSIPDPIQISDLCLCSGNRNEIAKSLDLSGYLNEENYAVYIPIRSEDLEALKTDRSGDWYCYLRYTDQYGFIHQRLIEPEDAPGWHNTNAQVSQYLSGEERIFDSDGNLIAVYISEWKTEH